MALQLSFPVGATEKHEVVFSWDRIWGTLTITVDGAPVVDTTRMFSARLVSSWTFSVGTTEKHLVQIDKRRKLFFAGFRAQSAVAYVDGIQVAQGVA
ncbi:MAG: hypothetical protein ABIP33_02165 [Pseudolysinimonas sp.]